MAVCILRLEEACDGCIDENDLRACWQGLSVEVAGDEANLSMVTDDDVKGARTRCADMMNRFEVASVMVFNCVGLKE